MASWQNPAQMLASVPLNEHFGTGLSAEARNGNIIPTLDMEEAGTLYLLKSEADTQACYIAALKAIIEGGGAPALETLHETVKENAKELLIQFLPARLAGYSQLKDVPLKTIREYILKRLVFEVQQYEPAYHPILPAVAPDDPYLHETVKEFKQFIDRKAEKIWAIFNVPSNLDRSAIADDWELLGALALLHHTTPVGTNIKNEIVTQINKVQDDNRALVVVDLEVFDATQLTDLTTRAVTAALRKGLALECVPAELQAYLTEEQRAERTRQLTAPPARTVPVRLPVAEVPVPPPVPVREDPSDIGTPAAPAAINATQRVHLENYARLNRHEYNRDNTTGRVKLTVKLDATHQKELSVLGNVVSVESVTDLNNAQRNVLAKGMVDAYIIAQFKGPGALPADGSVPPGPYHPSIVFKATGELAQELTLEAQSRALVKFVPAPPVSRRPAPTSEPLGDEPASRTVLA